jgi:hypothetical protein
MARTPLDQLSRRDRAVLRAVAAGRCRVTANLGMSLFVDDMPCCDQLIGRRLTTAGLIAVTDPRSGRAQLTSAGRAALVAA